MANRSVSLLDVKMVSRRSRRAMRVWIWVIRFCLTACAWDAAADLAVVVVEDEDVAAVVDAIANGAASKRTIIGKLDKRWFMQKLL
ncbi:protein of unknown function [Acidithiobacillus ferrivorans]|uniref:Uncharacterized protein n=1 Tax=Acidithiobacillus ferrivorans TaxID=160808 RepID=A0ABY1MLB0_9PROT|nr:protein of unknown function [Acidithiobacillus ferrivorans]